MPFAVLDDLLFGHHHDGRLHAAERVEGKENRTIEVLLLSLRPRDLMLGKILGLGVIALLEITMWGGAMLLFGGVSLNGLSSLGLPDGFFFWALLYFVLGYLLYASLLGALGALAPSMREGTQFTFLVLLPLSIPLMLNSVLIQLPTAADRVPEPVPIDLARDDDHAAGERASTDQQLVLGLVILAITTFSIIAYSARFFRAIRCCRSTR